MANYKSYFQDRTVLLLISIEAFLTLLASALILLRLNAARGTVTFMSQFRSLPNATDFATGGVGVNGTVWDILSFIVAAVGVLTLGLGLSHRVYGVRRELAVVILALTFVLLMLIIAVSNILLVLR